MILISCSEFHGHFSHKTAILYLLFLLLQKSLIKVTQGKLYMQHTANRILYPFYFYTKTINKISEAFIICPLEFKFMEASRC